MHVDAAIEAAQNLKDERPHGCHNPYCDVELEVRETSARPAYTELWICTDCNGRWAAGDKPKWLTELQSRNR